MGARIIDGKAIALATRARIAEAVAARVAAGLAPPGLATVLVGEDPASEIYVAGKQRACAEAGIVGFDHRLAADSTQAQVQELLATLAHDARVSGILLQLPTPEGIDGSALTSAIAPSKDVDGLTPISAGRLVQGKAGLTPCTPAGCMELLRQAGVAIAGAQAVVLGRSDLVGKPIAQLLLAADATVTVCHSRTRELPAVCRRADILIAAVGRAEMVRGDWIKPGATVIDVGINRTDDGLRGDVAFDEVAAVAGALTPVPGGVGPMTIAMLLSNTLLAAEQQDA